MCLCDQKVKRWFRWDVSKHPDIVCCLQCFSMFCSTSKTDYHFYPFSSIDVEKIGCTHLLVINFEFHSVLRVLREGFF